MARWSLLSGCTRLSLAIPNGKAWSSSKPCVSLSLPVRTSATLLLSSLRSLTTAAPPLPNASYKLTCCSTQFPVAASLGPSPRRSSSAAFALGGATPPTIACRSPPGVMPAQEIMNHQPTPLLPKRTRGIKSSNVPTVMASTGLPPVHALFTRRVSTNRS